EYLGDPELIVAHEAEFAARRHLDIGPHVFRLPLAVMDEHFGARRYRVDQAFAAGDIVQIEPGRDRDRARGRSRFPQIARGPCCPPSLAKTWESVWKTRSILADMPSAVQALDR